LQIRFSKDVSNRLICTIDDNGVGLKRAAEIGKTRHTNEHSFGIETTISRLEAINFRDANKNEVSIREKTENNISQGTQVTVIIDLN
jgi:sensor histidine kinase YesM